MFPHDYIASERHSNAKFSRFKINIPFIWNSSDNLFQIFIQTERFNWLLNERTQNAEDEKKECVSFNSGLIDTRDADIISWGFQYLIFLQNRASERTPARTHARTTILRCKNGKGAHNKKHHSISIQNDKSIKSKNVRRQRKCFDLKRNRLREKIQPLSLTHPLTQTVRGHRVVAWCEIFSHCNCEWYCDSNDRHFTIRNGA